MHQIILEHKTDKHPVGYVRSSAEAFYEEGICPIKRKQSRRAKKRKTALIKRRYMDVIWNGGTTWAGAPTCGTLINKNAAIEVGGYNNELSPCPDCYLPYHMLKKYGVYQTYYSFGKYRWGQNDTYKKTTLIRLIAAYEEYLTILAEKEPIVRFFINEHYADCVHYYTSKGKEAGVEITNDDLSGIRALNYSKVKLKLLLLLRRINSGLGTMLAK